MFFAVTVKGAERLTKRLRDIGEKAPISTADVMNTTALEVERSAKEIVQHGSDDTSVISNTGRLAQSIHTKKATARSQEALVSAGASYAPYVEFGTSPHWAPIEPLLTYVSQKYRLGTDVGENSEAWAAAKGLQAAIAAHGTMAHPFMHPAAEAQRIPHRERMAAALAEAMRA